MSISKLLLVSSSLIWLYWHNRSYFTPNCLFLAITCSFLSPSVERLSLFLLFFFSFFPYIKLSGILPELAHKRVLPMACG